MKKSYWIFNAVAFTLLALVTSGIQKKVFAGPPAAEVKIDNFSFEPVALMVKPGTQITWTNGDDIPHTVVSDNQGFKSKVLDTGEKFTFTASQPGTYAYFCSIHPKMTGKVIVQ